VSVAAPAVADATMKFLRFNLLIVFGN